MPQTRCDCGRTALPSSVSKRDRRYIAEEVRRRCWWKWGQPGVNYARAKNGGYTRQPRRREDTCAELRALKVRSTDPVGAWTTRICSVRPDPHGCSCEAIPRPVGSSTGAPADRSSGGTSRILLRPTRQVPLPKAGSRQCQPSEFPFVHVLVLAQKHTHDSGW